MAKTIELGDIARDTITGFQGVVVARTKWLHGCERITLQPKEMKDGKPIDNYSFDVPQCELVQSSAHRGTDDTGGPRPEPVRASAPR